MMLGHFAVFPSKYKIQWTLKENVPLRYESYNWRFAAISVVRKLKNDIQTYFFSLHTKVEKYNFMSFNEPCNCDKSVNKERRNEGTKDRNAGRGRGQGAETWERGTRNPMASSK